MPMAIVVISFDGLSDKEFEKIADDTNCPNIAAFKKQALYKGGIKTIFLSNTYPIHTTVSTGKLPKEHGIISNYIGTGKKRRWAIHSKHIKAETIWDAARKKGLNTAAIIWPVTYGADIKWNIPEIHLGGGDRLSSKNKLSENLFTDKLKINAPVWLDNFAASAAHYLLKYKSPDLCLIHLVAYDIISHTVGSKSDKMAAARKSLDKCLGKILKAAENHSVLVFSDHAHLDVTDTIDLKRLFGANVHEQCGGSAFFKSPADNIESYPWFGRFLTQKELEESGYIGNIGIAAKPGYNFGNKKDKSDHGYPADYDDYRVFYALQHKNPGEVASDSYGDLRDVTSTIRKILEL
jgi:predicted AlkP superfamily pyrophosphatase or phosphodiesterase